MDLPEFELIYKKWNTSLQKYAHYFVRDEESSRSIVNDLFLHLWFSKKQPENLQGYLYRAVKNASLNHIRKNGNVPLLYLVDDQLTTLSDAIPESETRSIDSEKVRFLNKVISLLPERRQMVFRLHRLEGFSYAEIAELMHISVRTVEDHLAKSMQFIHSHAKQLVDLSLTEA